MNDYLFPQKSELKKLKVSDINIELPDLKNSDDTKAITIGKWLANWIDKGLKDSSLSLYCVLPTKPELAYKLGVSIGTIQAALRYLEDIGYVEAKQCIGTIISDRTREDKTIRKLVSKKDLAVNAIKNYILTGGFSQGSKLPTINTIATIIGFTVNTTKIALNYLLVHNYLYTENINFKEKALFVKTLDFKQDFVIGNKVETLVEMVEKDILNYILKNCKVGDRLPAHDYFTKNLKASLKTVHDAFNSLTQKGYILPKRGKYGTLVTKLPNSNDDNSPQDRIFATATDAAFYHYEKVQKQLTKIIVNDYEIGEKLPSIKELTKQLDVSPNTIRKAFNKLAKEGYIVFSRGRYGGTFIIDKPETEEQSFKWLAVNPNYASVYSTSVNLESN